MKNVYFYPKSNGKKTEIEQINGAIIRIAYENSIYTPLNLLMTRAIKRIEGLRSAISSGQEFYLKHHSYLEKVQEDLLSNAGLANKLTNR